ncbi:MAG: hypothetical protein ACRDT2_05340 [Natronosporangium sp.]
MTIWHAPPARPAVRAGVAVGVLGVVLFAGAFGLDLHAAQSRQVQGGEPFPLTAAPVLVVALVEPGVAVEQPVTCTVSLVTGDPGTVEVRTRRDPTETIRSGRRLTAPGPGQASVVCDRRVIVATGPLVYAYPLAGPTVLRAGYLLLALLGFGYARRRGRRSAAAGVIQAGDDADRSELRRYTADVLWGAVQLVCGLTGLLLGVVGLLGLAQGAPGGLLILAVATVPSAGWFWVWRRDRRPV